MWGVSELHQECAKHSEGGEQGTSHSVERSVMKQRYAKVSVAAALPFAREVWSSVGPVHRLCSRFKRMCDFYPSCSAVRRPLKGVGYAKSEIEFYTSSRFSLFVGRA